MDDLTIPTELEVAAQVDSDWLIRLRCVNCQRLGSTEFDLIDLAVGYLSWSVAHMALLNVALTAFGG